MICVVGTVMKDCLPLQERERDVEQLLHLWPANLNLHALLL